MIDKLYLPPPLLDVIRAVNNNLNKNIIINDINYKPQNNSNNTSNNNTVKETVFIINERTPGTKTNKRKYEESY